MVRGRREAPLRGRFYMLAIAFRTDPQSHAVIARLIVMTPLLMHFNPAQYSARDLVLCCIWCVRPVRIYSTH